MAEATISIKRLQSFMLYEDTSKPVPGLAEIQTSTKKGKEFKDEPRESVLSNEVTDAKDGTEPILKPEIDLKPDDNAKGNGKLSVISCSYNRCESLYIIWINKFRRPLGAVERARNLGF